MCNPSFFVCKLKTLSQQLVCAKKVGTRIALYKVYNASKPVDVLLLGPQVRFMKSQFETKLADKGIPVDVIDMKDYGMMNGEAVLGTALSLMK